MSSGVNSRIFNLLKENFIKNRQDISPEDIPDLEVRVLRGIGNKVWQKLKKQKIITIRDLAAAPIETLIKARISPRLAEKWSLAGKVILDSASK
ncbi:MAG: hypothetical protein ACFFCQ_18835, partial [Promethearchaeota archaeon]